MTKVQKNKRGNGFKSKHDFSLNALLKSEKLFHQKCLSTLEQKQRVNLQKKPGFLLLLNEIYENLNENFQREERILPKIRKLDDNDK